MTNYRTAIIACGMIRVHDRGWLGVPRKRQRIHLPLKIRVNPLTLMVESGALPVEWPGRYERRARIVRSEAMSWHETA